MQEKNWVNILIKENKHPLPPKVLDAYLLSII